MELSETIATLPFRRRPRCAYACDSSGERVIVLEQGRPVWRTRVRVDDWSVYRVLGRRVIRLWDPEERARYQARERRLDALRRGARSRRLRAFAADLAARHRGVVQAKLTRGAGKRTTDAALPYYEVAFSRRGYGLELDVHSVGVLQREALTRGALVVPSATHEDRGRTSFTFAVLASGSVADACLLLADREQAWALVEAVSALDEDAGVELLHVDSGKLRGRLARSPRSASAHARRIAEALLGHEGAHDRPWVGVLAAALTRRRLDIDTDL